jgi:hypothetical protein
MEEFVSSISGDSDLRFAGGSPLSSSETVSLSPACPAPDVEELSSSSIDRCFLFECSVCLRSIPLVERANLLRRCWFSWMRLRISDIVPLHYHSSIVHHDKQYRGIFLAYI